MAGRLAVITAKEQPRTIRGNPFAKGVSGNPAGRPKGSRNRTTRAALDLLDGDAERLTRRLIALAMNGDSTALKLCFDRIIPPVKDRRLNLDLPSVKTSTGLVAALDCVLGAVASGDLTLSEAQQLTSILEVQRRTLETEELDSRIKCLEEARRDAITEADRKP